MSVEFILGRAGTGKSRYCLDSIVAGLGADDSGPVVLLLPEQATYQAERAILSSDGIYGYSNLHILSFNRLQFRLAQLAGRNAGGVELSRLGCEMVVSKVISEKSTELSILANSSDKSGTSKQLASIITRLQEGEITPAEVIEAAKNLSKNNTTLLAGKKLADIGLIYQSYIEFFNNSKNEMINPDSRLSDAKKDVAKATFLNNARVFVDGFASFTRQELELLMEVVKVSAHTSIALCLDPTKVNLVNPDTAMLDPLSMFTRTERTYVELVEAVRACKVKVAPAVLLNEVRRFSNTALKHIEKEVFAEEQSPPISADRNIKIVSASNPRREVECIAEKIIELVKECGYRFRDIAVVASDLGEYQHYISASFADHGLACFIDQPNAMSSHPVAELIDSAVRATCGMTSTSDIIAYLKTDLGTLDRKQIDVLENYCLACGVDGKDWYAKAKWDMAGGNSAYDKEVIDKLRREAIKPIANFGKKLNEKITTADFAKAIFGLFDELDVKDKLAEWTQQDEGGIHQQFYNKLVDIFDEMAMVFGEEKAEAAQFAKILSGSLADMKLKLIPQKLDQVLIGSIERSRHPDLKAVFLAGANQKQFPCAISTETLLTEEDKIAASELELDLGEGLIEQLAARQYLAYIAFSRPCEYLHISYAQSDSGGKSHILSPFVGNVIRLFDDLDVENSGAGGISGKNNAADRLCALAGKDSDIAEEDAEALAKKLAAENIEAGNILQAAISYDNIAEINGEKLKAEGNWFVVDGKLMCSTSRLTAFAECPYKHFAKYILKLKARDMMKLEAMDLGSFYHKVLDSVAKKMMKQGVDFGSIDDDKIETLCKKQIEHILETDAVIGNFARTSQFNRYIITSAVDTIVDAAKGYAEMSRAGNFKLYDSEVKFGFDGGKAELKFVLSDRTEVVLRGVVDRLEAAEIEGQTVGLVFDYKLNDKSINYSKLANRLDMQLPVYMLAVRSMEVGGKKIDASAGAFYLPIQVKIADGSLDTVGVEKKKFGYKAKGIFNGEMYECLDNNADKDSKFYNFYVGKDGTPYGNFKTRGAITKDQLEAMLAFTKESIVKLSEEIISGSIDITPYRLGNNSPCGYCDMRAVCRFDWQVNKYNSMEKCNKGQWFERLGVGYEK